MPPLPSVEQPRRFVGFLSRLKSPPIWISLVYAVFSAIWIYFSDHALAFIADNPVKLVEWSVYKGFAFVGATSLLLFFLVRSGFRELEKSNKSLTLHEIEIERLTRMYAALSQINQAIVTVPNREELLQKICRVLVEFGGFHGTIERTGRSSQ